MVLLKESILHEIRKNSGFDLYPINYAVASPRISGMTKHGLVASPSQREGELEIENLDESLMSIAGFDLRVGDEIYLSHNQRAKIPTIHHLQELAKNGELKRLEPDKNGKFTLEHDINGNKIYYIATYERLRLSQRLDLRIDAKSTIGRLGVMCDNKADMSSHTMFTQPIIFTAQPYAFDLHVTPGKSSLIQAILRNKSSPFMTHEQILNGQRVVSFSEKGREALLEEIIREDGLQMTYDTSAAIAAKKVPPCPIDVDAPKRYYKGEDFYKLVKCGQEVSLNPKTLYLMRTIQRINLRNACGILSREAKHTGTGLWGHFAGFIWPGFEGPITMECRSESRRIISHGDPAAFLQLDNLPRELSSQEAYSGSYQKVNPLTPKMFTPLE